MPVRFYSFFRVTFPAVLSLVFGIVIALHASPAFADPHAVFYTDRAQEQLFYNVLAALNQADYVEPGIPGSIYSRTNLVTARNNSAITESLQNGAPSPIPYATPTIVEQSTHTNLPGVVTRNITLEGNDLWTAYLFQQFSLETDVRRGISKLARLYCENSLGRAGCSNLPGPAQEQSTSFPSDANAYAQQANLTLASALFTGEQQEKDFQGTLTGTKPANPDPNAAADALHPENVQEPNLPAGVKFPRSQSSEINSLRDNTKNNPDALSLVNTITSNVLGAYYSSNIDPYAFSNIQFTDNGNGGKTAKVADNATFDDYINALTGIGSLVTGSIQIADQAYEEGKTFQQNRENTPSLGQYTLTKNPNGGVKGTVTVPSSAIAANINASANLLPNEAIGQKIASNQEINTPGQQPDLLSARSGGTVAGITTSDPSQPSTLDSGNVAGTGAPTGQVAGLTDFSPKIEKLYNDYYASPQPNPNNPTTGLIPAYEETGNSQLLEAMGIKIPNPNPKEVTCGFCTDLSGIIGTSTATSTTSSSIFSDLYCYFFPTVQSCVIRKEPVPTVLP